MKKFGAILTGIAIGTGVLGLGATAGALVVAHKKAKENDQTTSEYIKGKAKYLANKCATKIKKNSVCPICERPYSACECDDVDLSFEDEGAEFISDIDDYDDEELILASEDMFATVLNERNEYKRKYEELVKSLEAASKDKEDARNEE